MHETRPSAVQWWRGNHCIGTPSGSRPGGRAGQPTVRTQLRTHVPSQCLRRHDDDPRNSAGRAQQLAQGQTQKPDDFATSSHFGLGEPPGFRIWNPPRVTIPRTGKRPSNTLAGDCSGTHMAESFAVLHEASVDRHHLQPENQGLLPPIPAARWPMNPTSWRSRCDTHERALNALSADRHRAVLRTGHQRFPESANWPQ
jgi:hypothetical protein